MNRRDLEALLDYHYWARDRMLDAVQLLAPEQYTRDMHSSLASVRDTLAHTYFAEWSWHSRWLGRSPTKGREATEFADVASLRAAWREMESNVRAFVGGLGERDVEREVQYHLLSGQPGKSRVWQMVQHVVNHATYHRGQVTTMLRQMGAQPPKEMDLDTFYRERGA
jgi:uncharacterized damage-inducible protein DinB